MAGRAWDRNDDAKTERVEGESRRQGGRTYSVSQGGRDVAVPPEVVVEALLVSAWQRRERQRCTRAKRKHGQTHFPAENVM